MDRPHTVPSYRKCGTNHWCIPNLFSVAIELVCGGSPIAWVLVECKAQHSGNGSNSSTETFFFLNTYYFHKADIIVVAILIIDMLLTIAGFFILLDFSFQNSAQLLFGLLR